MFTFENSRLFKIKIRQNVAQKRGARIEGQCFSVSCERRVKMIFLGGTHEETVFQGQ